MLHQLRIKIYITTSLSSLVFQDTNLASLSLGHISLVMGRDTGEQGLVGI